MSGSAARAPLPTPLPKAVKERTERKAGYQASTAEVAKWQSMVKLGRAGGWWGAGGAGPVTRPVEVAKR